MEQLIEEYRMALKFINNLRLRAETYHIDTREKIIVNISEDDYKMLGSYISNLQYSIDYMRTGHIPGNRRGIYRQSKEKREIPVDPQIYHFVSDITGQSRPKYSTISRDQQDLLDDLLDSLSKEQKEALKLVRGERMSYSKAGIIMGGISKSLVQYHVREAEKKLTAVVQKPEDKEMFIQRIIFSEVV